jgi:hypothetical protein
VSFMVDREEPKLLSCIFCGKELDKSNAMRYQGAIACKECILAQKPQEDFKERPFFIIGALGAVVGLFEVTIAVFSALSFTPLQGDLYIPLLMFYFGGMTFAVLFQGIGFYGLNCEYIPIAGIACILTALASAVTQIAAIWDLIVAGPYYEIEGEIYTKGFGYYSLAISMYALFTLVVGLSVILYIGQTKLENVILVTGVMYLIGGFIGSLGALWPPVGFLHIFMYIIATLFFFTRTELVTRGPIETLGYQTVKNT